MILRALAAVLAILAVLGGCGVVGYVVGVRRGASLVQRWAPMIETAVEWRRQEMQNDPDAASVQLGVMRQLIDKEEDNRDRAYRELESSKRPRLRRRHRRGLGLKV